MQFEGKKCGCLKGGSKDFDPVVLSFNGRLILRLRCVACGSDERMKIFGGYEELLNFLQENFRQLCEVDGIYLQNLGLYSGRWNNQQILKIEWDGISRWKLIFRGNSLI